MARSMMALLAVAALVFLSQALTVQAACPNSCSGHGSCGADEVCSCYPNWQGGDCSKRTCPFVKSWADILDSSVTDRAAHYYAECGNKGVCDRQTGQCLCEDGFEGEGCDRMSCNGGANCNGHGTCEQMSSVNSGYALWDASKVQVCQCDPGYEGHDCSMRKCKLGDDPMSLYAAGSAEVDEEQTITIGSSATFTAAGAFVLGFTDWRGEEWITRPIDVDTISVIAIREALLTLPQRAIDDVTVTITTDTTSSIVFVVTFTSSETPGNQPALNVYTDGCVLHGCQPYYAGVAGGTITTTVVETTAGTSERAVCSSRGHCDSETGICKCFSGFYGVRC